MVRIIVGTLLDISRGSGKDMISVITALDRKMAGKTAQAQGLFFTGANYKNVDLKIGINSNPLSFILGPQ
jgi:tRNA U38,U39,U40 pseudouridine synthase TruA